MNTTKKTRPEVKNYVNQNPFESVKDIGKGVAQSVVNDVGKDSVTALWDQLLGTRNYEQGTSGELMEGQEIDLRNHGKKHKTEQIEAGEIAINYRREILHGENRTTRENQKEMDVKIQEIIIELKRLAASSQELQVQFKEVTAEQRITKPGKYHVSFFEWVPSVVRSARLKVEDSGAWLAMFKSKKAQKQYWNMFKKHGTTFGLSNERVVATQTG